jgi:hypothetical protein
VNVGIEVLFTSALGLQPPGGTVANVAGQFDRVRVISRGGHLCFDSEASVHEDSAIDALRRGQSTSDDRLGEVAASWQIVRSLAEGRGADTSYLQAVDRHHDHVIRSLE